MSVASKHIKVCHFGSVHNQTDTRVFYRECQWLAHDFDVTLIAIGKFTGVKNGVKLIGLPKPANRLKRLWHTTRQVYKLAKQEQADIYHFHDPELIPFAWLLKLQGKKVVYDVHENVTESLKDKSWLPLKGLFIKLYLWFDALAARNFSLVLAEQWYEKVYKYRYPKNAFTLVRNFAPAALLKPFVNTQRQVSNNQVRIFYMGSIDELYCCTAMLESIAILNKQGIDASLNMIGWCSDQTKASIEQLPFWEQIKHKVFLPGFMDVQEGFKHSLNCNLGYSFVSDNLNVSQSFPRKMYEYMHIGLPVITSGHLLYKNMVETYATGLYVSSNTAVEIAQTVKAMMQSGEYLNTLAQNNIQAAQQHFNWETEYESLKGLYQNLVKK
jgi:glycosyltransferase involved in cell wall biosynthesis